jgi:hypothetical protein
MSHYDNELCQRKQAITKELRRLTKQKIDKLPSEELEFAYMVINHIEDFMRTIDLMKLINKS